MRIYIGSVFIAVCSYLVFSILSFGFPTVMKCGAIESLPIEQDRCWNIVTGEINLKDE